MIDRQKFKTALERFAMGLSSADKQMRPKTAQAGGQAMAYALSVALGAVEMPDEPPMEVAWDNWARRKGEGDDGALALAALTQMIPPPIREEEPEAGILGQIALWLDLVAYDDPENPDSDNLVARTKTPEAEMAEAAADQALDDLVAAREALRQCLLSEEDAAACDPNREAVAAAERQLEAAVELVVANAL